MSKVRIASVGMSRHAGAGHPQHLLYAEMLCRPRDVIVRKRSHEVVAVVIVGLHAKVDALVMTNSLGRLDEVFGQELALLVEVVSSTLFIISML